ncbi:MAG: TlpA family protein disulfide reductase [Betaproteobacteria bacterium]
MSALGTALLLQAALAAPQVAAPAAATTASEARVVEYLKAHVRPGQPVIVSELYNDVFTAPDERAALDRLFDAFFKVPLFLAQQQQATGRPPTLAQLAEQFRFLVPGEADLMLRILESDPRLPRFVERDAASGEITRVDVAAILSDPRFGRALERTIAGWEGRRAPAFSAEGEGGPSVGSGQLAGKPYLLYFWFSGCPPCARTGPLLSAVQQRYGPRGLAIVALNADRVLEVPATAAERAAYAKRNGWTFLRAEADAPTIEAYGSVSVFPTFFWIDRHGVVVRYLVNYQELETLEQAAQRALR